MLSRLCAESETRIGGGGLALSLSYLPDMTSSYEGGGASGNGFLGSGGRSYRGNRSTGNSAPWLVLSLRTVSFSVAKWTETRLLFLPLAAAWLWTLTSSDSELLLEARRLTAGRSTEAGGAGVVSVVVAPLAPLGAAGATGLHFFISSYFQVKPPRMKQKMQAHIANQTHQPSFGS